MISKDRVGEEGEKQTTPPESPDSPPQVNRASRSNVPNMAGSSAATVPVGAESHRGTESAHHNNENVHHLLGRSFNGDLIASQVYLCITCGLELEDAESLRRHELCCVNVDSSTNLPGSAINLEEGEGFRKLVCEICRAYFSETDHLQEHKLLHLNTSNVCYLCDTFFTNRYLLARHVVCQHSDRFGVKQNEEGVHEPYTCAICILRFSTLIALQAHEDSHGATEMTPTCRVCSVSNASQQALQTHLKSGLHAEMKLQLQNLFTCIDCSTVFHCRDAYAMHMMMRAKDESCKKTSKRIALNEVTKSTTSVVVVKEEPIDVSVTTCDDSAGRFSRPPNRASPDCPGGEDSVAGNSKVCPGCGQLCYDSNHLMRHLRMCGSVLSPQTNDNWAPAQNGLVFKWAVNKSYSLQLSNSRKEKLCAYCHKSFLDQDDLAMHVMSDHTGDIAESEEGRTTSPPENTRLWRTADRVSRPAFSPVGLRVSRELHESVVPNSLDKQKSLVPKNLTDLNVVVVSEKENASVASSDSEHRPAFLASLSCPSNDNQQSYEEMTSRKRHRDRSPSLQFKPRRRFDECRSKSADIAIYCKDSEVKPTRLSTPPAWYNSRSNIHTPLDLSRGLRDADFDSNQNRRKEAKQPEIDTNTNGGASNETVMANSQSNENNPEVKDGEPPLLEFLVENRNRLFQCRHCNIVFFDRTLHCLHMGLHNRRNPWQCNMCGKTYDTVHEFHSHALHY